MRFLLQVGPFRIDILTTAVVGIRSTASSEDHPYDRGVWTDEEERAALRNVTPINKGRF